MATPTYPSTHRTALASDGSQKALGQYNRSTTASGSTTETSFIFTGSAAVPAGAGFICEVVTNVVMEAVKGGTIPGTTLTADTLYPIAPQKVTIGASGKVYVLHK